DAFRLANVEGTRVLLEACADHAPGLARFVLAGSRAAAPPSATGVDEDAPLAPVEPYGASKAEAERIAFSYADRLPVAVARPPRIMGPGDRENLLFFRIASAGLALSFGDRPLSWIDVDDCARGLLLLADRPEARGESFFLASPERTTALALMSEAARALGVRARRIPVPAPLLRGVAGVSDALSRATGRRLPISRKLAAQVLAPGWACDPGKARERLGFVATTSLAESVARSAAWYRAERWL
ncbi:MAG TPA: NAD-dependent epimerase/dehydratase family protein, partial [Anaeromyxobacteraceae bacterium]|nr:NAD-dependent epimerase/dehydratase family protein [Anaeromyxobacteraceae bacterium]